MSIDLGYRDDVNLVVHGYLGSVGIQNVYCEETCGIDNVAIQDVASIGIEDYSNTSQNAGPWTNLVVSTNTPTGYANNDCGYGTTGIVLADAPDRGIDGWTVTFQGGSVSGSCSSHEPVAAILMDKPATPILNGHNENTRDAVLIGSQGADYGGSQIPVAAVRVDGLFGPPGSAGGTSLVHVSNVFSSLTFGNVFRNLARQTGTPNAVQDDIVGYNCTDQTVTYYETDAHGFPSTDCNASTGTPSAFVLNNGTFGIYSASSTAGSSMDATQVLSPLHTAAGNLTLKPGTSSSLFITPTTDSTQAVQLKQASGGAIFASFDTSNKRFRIGDATAPTVTLDVAGDEAISGTIKNYKGVATVRGGVPSAVGSVDTGALSGAASGTLYSVPSNGAGLYTACWTAVVTVAALTSSTLGGATGFQLTYTDLDTGGSVTTPAAGAPAAGSNTAYSQTNQKNTVGTQASGCTTINVTASSTISYGFGYTSGSGTLMQYKLHIVLDAHY